MQADVNAATGIKQSMWQVTYTMWQVTYIGTWLAGSMLHAACLVGGSLLGFSQPAAGAFELHSLQTDQLAGMTGS